MFFRPICAECNACESLKIDVKAFELSKSMKRIMKKNAHLRLVVQKPTVSHEHIELFKNYHDYMGNKRGWNTQEVSQKNYYSSFVHAHHDYGYEILYYDNETLIAVDLIDILPNGVSSIYFYYNPKYEKNSLGKYSMYRQILYAKQQNLEWIHMGYYVKECQSLSYKSDYKPHLLLTNRPLDDENPQWITLPDR
jgi:arginine-tRNA-protein transferase